MRKFRFELLAHTKIDIQGEDINEAMKQAFVEWHNIFENGLYGDVRFIKEVKEEEVEKMKKYECIKLEGDAEIYEVNGEYIKVVWGYATGSDTGWHNEFDTDVCVYRWTGEECEVDELPGAMDSDWKAVLGFDLSTKENSYGNPEVDWEDYAEKVNKILADVESGHYE